MLTQHPLSAAFPAMAHADLEALSADIKANGLRQAIVTLDGQVLDGWHRYQACVLAKVTPRTVPYDGADPVGFVLSLNLSRRHLTSSQRAAAIAACAEWAPEGRREGNMVPGTMLTLDRAAKLAETSKSTVQHAKAAQAAGLGEAVRDGRISAKRGAEIAKLPPEKRAAAIEAPPQRVATTAKQVEPGAPTDDEVEALKQEALTDLAEELSRVIDADDKLAAMADEMKRIKAVVRAFETRQQGMAGELALAIKDAQRWMRKYEKAAKACTCGACK